MDKLELRTKLAGMLWNNFKTLLILGSILLVANTWFGWDMDFSYFLCGLIVGIISGYVCNMMDLNKAIR